jgi:hypothetical protein
MSKLIIAGRGTDLGVRHNHNFIVYNDSYELEYTSTYESELKDISIRDQRDWGGKPRPAFRPFGITFDDDKIYIANHTKIGIFNKTTYAYEGLLGTPGFFNTHQILKKDNIMYTANTRHDTIGVHNLDTNESTYINLSEKSHVNSLFWSEDNKLCYVLHNRGLKLSEFFKDGVKIKEVGKCCHNLILEGDNFYTLDTYNKKLIINDNEYVVPDGGFIRGLAKLGNELVIGQSLTNDIPNTPADCFLHIFNLTSNTFTDKITVPEVREITDIKWI